MLLPVSEHWTKDQVSNTTAREAMELGMWFSKEQQLSEKPLLDGGICAVCGCLFCGISSAQALHNVYHGPPVAGDGNILYAALSEELQFFFSASVVTSILCRQMP